MTPTETEVLALLTLVFWAVLFSAMFIRNPSRTVRGFWLYLPVALSIALAIVVLL